MNNLVKRFYLFIIEKFMYIWFNINFFYLLLFYIYLFVYELLMFGMYM